MALHQFAHHRQGIGAAFCFGDRGQLADRLAAVGGTAAEGADALGDRVQGVPELCVLLHEHQVQRVEHRPGDIPVEAMGFGVEHRAVGQHPRQARGDLLPLVGGDADIDGGGADGHRNKPR